MRVVCAALCLGVCTALVDARAYLPEVETIRARVRVRMLDGSLCHLSDFKIVDGKWLEGRTKETIGVPGASAGLRRLALAELWRIEPEGSVGNAEEKSAAAKAVSPLSPELMLRGGVRLAAQFKEGRGTELLFEILSQRPSERKPVAIAKAYIQGLRLERAAPEGKDAGFAASFAKPHESLDYLFVWNKSRKKLRRLSGQIDRVDSESFVLSKGGKEYAIPVARVHAAVFSRASGISDLPRAKGSVVTVRSRSGSIAKGVWRNGRRAGSIGLEVFPGVVLPQSFRDVESIEFENPRLRYLSSMPFRSDSSVVGLLRKWPVLIDHGPGGGPLRVGDDLFRRGFLVTPGAKLDFDLDGRPATLFSKIGMPAAKFGSTKMQVFVDDKQLGPEISLTSDGKIHPLRLKLQGKILSLKFLLSEDLDAGGLVVLGDARLVQDA